MNRINDYTKLADDITNWIRDYATTNNIKSLVVGVSGGIDSAVVSSLCARTGLPTYCCVIDIHSRESCLSLAYNHCHWLSARYGSNISIVGRNLNRVLLEYRNDSRLEDPHVIANTKSRMRMTVLYEVAALHQGIVVGTGNKVEDFGIGFFCKGGDGMVDMSPIADLYKTEVWELGKHLGISPAIIEAVPTDDLFLDGRTDEQQIGATYEELEWEMDLRERLKRDGIFTFTTTDRQNEVSRIYTKLHKQNQHKMLPIPIYKLNNGQ
jgi:NAD+ synthase